MLWDYINKKPPLLQVGEYITKLDEIEYSAQITSYDYKKDELTFKVSQEEFIEERNEAASH